jgi:hypothetical protein
MHDWSSVKGWNDEIVNILDTVDSLERKGWISLYDINNLNNLAARFSDTEKKIERQPFVLYCIYRHIFMSFIDGQI